MPTPFPFSAIVGQDEMKQAILVAAVDPGVGGVLVFGDRGTGKSTAVRALAALLPPMRATEGCRYGCDPAPAARRANLCDDCRERRELSSACSTAPVRVWMPRASASMSASSPTQATPQAHCA